MNDHRIRLVRTATKWKQTHFPSKKEGWYIQNLLGDYLGWGSKEQKEISQLFSQEVRKANET